MLRETLGAARRTLGDGDALTLASVHNLSEALVGSGDASKLPEARKLAAEALDRRRRVLGETHLHTLRSALDLALLLKRDPDGDDAEAAALLTRAAAGYAAALGSDHPRTTHARSILDAWTATEAPEVVVAAARRARVARDADREHVALVDRVDVPDGADRAALLGALGDALAARGVASLVFPLRESDPLAAAALATDSSSVVGVATLDDDGRTFAYRVDLKSAA